MAALGVFDSGVGGLSVLRQVRALLPAENLIYVADQAHVPYGPRPAEEIQAFSAGITRFFLEQQARLIVVACNTASAAALTWLRHTFPQVPFVGMEPAVKPGALATRSGKVGVLATAGTFTSQRYASLMARFAGNVSLLESPCPGLVERIEAGEVASAETARLLRRELQPMLAAGIDTLILGCTHFPFVSPLLRQIVGPEVTIIDPAPAVARQVARLWPRQGPAGQPGQVKAFTTGDVSRFQALAAQLLSAPPPPTEALSWDESGQEKQLRRNASG